MQICPPTEQYPKVFDSENNCRLPEALKHIEEKCHDQQVCSMVTAPEVFGGGQGGRDPCPGFRKYVEVAYKCKPTQFRSKTSCQGDTMNLTCSNSGNEQDGDARVAIYSATFASSLGSHIYCPDYGDFGEASVRQSKCSDEANEATTEAIMEVCHGKGRGYTYKPSIMLVLYLVNA